MADGTIKFSQRSAVPTGISSGENGLYFKTDNVPYVVDSSANELPIALGGFWTNYTPTWTASTTNPVIGNGTLIGRYVVVGKVCTANIKIQAGSTTTYGSGNYYVSLPLTSYSPYSAFGYFGVGHIRNTSTASYPVIIHLEPSVDSGKTTYIVVTTAGTTALYWTPTAPFTFGNGDLFWMSITYETE